MPKHLDRFILAPPYDFTVTAAHYDTTLGVYREGRFRRVIRAGGGLALAERYPGGTKT